MGRQATGTVRRTSSGGWSVRIMVKRKRVSVHCPPNVKTEEDARAYIKKLLEAPEALRGSFFSSFLKLWRRDAVDEKYDLECIVMLERWIVPMMDKPVDAITKGDIVRVRGLMIDLARAGKIGAARIPYGGRPSDGKISMSRVKKIWHALSRAMFMATADPRLKVRDDNPMLGIIPPYGGREGRVKVKQATFTILAEDDYEKNYIEFLQKRVAVAEDEAAELREQLKELGAGRRSADEKKLASDNTRLRKLLSRMRARNPELHRRGRDLRPDWGTIVGKGDADGGSEVE